MTITYDALDLAFPDIGPQCTGTASPAPRHATSLYSDTPGPQFPRFGTSLYRDPLLLISGDQNWRPVQTCSLEDSTSNPCCADIWWLFLLECFLVLYHITFWILLVCAGKCGDFPVILRNTSEDRKLGH